MAEPKTGASHKDAPAKDTAAADAAAAPPALVKSTVAHGRSVMKDGSRYLPGAIIELPAEETVRLVSLGFLHDPHAVVIETGMGPTFSRETANIVRPQ